MLHQFHFVLYALYFGVFIFAISWWKFFEIEELSRVKLIAFFAFKVWAGLVLTLVYTYYYTDQCKSDIYHYFNDSKIISSILFSNPKVWFKLMSGIGPMDNETFSYIQDTWYFLIPPGESITNNTLLIKIISLLNYFSLYNIYITTLLLNFISFIGLTFFFKSLRSYFKKNEFALQVSIYLIPSVAFWGSGLLKESLLLPALGTYIYACFKVAELPCWRRLLLPVVMLLVIVFTKIYIAVLLILCTPFLIMSKADKKISGRVVWLLSGLYAIILVSGMYLYGGGFCSQMLARRNEFTQLALVENAGSLLDTTIVSSNCNHILTLLPSSIVNAVLRPFLWDNGNILQLLFAFENFVFIAVIVTLLLFFFKKPDVPKLWLSVFCFSFAMLNYLLIGLTIPVLGAIVHYRVVAMPFLLLSALLLTNFGKLQQVLAKFKFSRS